MSNGNKKEESQEKKTAYLVRLTDQIIRENNYALLFETVKRQDIFLSALYADLGLQVTESMNPKTLLRIMGSFEPSRHVVASHDELFFRVRYKGDPMMLFLDLVTKCLAYFIRDRFNPELAEYVPQYVEEKK